MQQQIDQLQARLTTAEASLKAALYDRDTTFVAYNRLITTRPISVVNRSTSFPDAHLPALVEALQLQINEHFQPYWGIRSTLTGYRTDETPSANVAQLVLIEDALSAEANGWHELTNDGYALGKVFVKQSINAGVGVGYVASHEHLEMNSNYTTAMYMYDQAGSFHMLECCDMVNSRRYPSPIRYPDGRGIELADFGLPSWFDRTGKAPFAFLEASGIITTAQGPSLITRPFQLASGGFELVYKSGSGFATNIFTWATNRAPSADPAKFRRSWTGRLLPSHGSRREMLMMRPNKRRRSVA